MTFNYFDWIKALLGSDIPAAAKLRGVALATFADWETGYCYPNYAQIEHVLRNSSTGRTHEHLTMLRNAHFIRVVKHRSQSAWASNGYFLVAPTTVGTNSPRYISSIYAQPASEQAAPISSTKTECLAPTSVGAKSLEDFIIDGVDIRQPPPWAAAR